MSVHPIFSNILCSFGMHEWVERKQKGGTLAWRYRHYRCRHCPAELIDEK